MRQPCEKGTRGELFLPEVRTTPVHTYFAADFRCSYSGAGDAKGAGGQITAATDGSFFFFLFSSGEFDSSWTIRRTPKRTQHVLGGRKNSSNNR
jgi:ribosomal protein L24E